MKSRTLKSIVLGLCLSLTGCIPNKVDMDKEGNLIFNLHYNEEKSGEYEFIDDSKDLELFLYNIRTKNLERLTNNDVHDGWVDFSPDGKKALYTSDDMERLYLLDILTKKGTEIYESEGLWYPLWLDNDKITFVELINGSWKDKKVLKLIDTRTGGIEEIADLSAFEYVELHPSYGSDGVIGVLVEEKRKEGNYKVYPTSLVFIDLEGKIEVLYKSSCDEESVGLRYHENPYFEILFTTVYKGKSYLHIVNRKTRHHKEILSYSSKFILFPQWANDYEHILTLVGKSVNSDKDKERDVGLYIMNRDGENKKRIIKADINYFFQSPNGEIIYTTYSEIYKTDLRGKEIRNLTEEIGLQLQLKSL